MKFSEKYWMNFKSVRMYLGSSR